MNCPIKTAFKFEANFRVRPRSKNMIYLTSLLLIMIFFTSCSPAGKDYLVKEIAGKEIISNAIRPDVVAIDNKLYLAYRNGPFPKVVGFGVVILDSELNVLKSHSDIPTSIVAGFQRSDIRVATDSQSHFWYVYENAYKEPACGKNTVDAAISDQNIKLKTIKTNLSSGCTSVPKGTRVSSWSIGKDMEISDDPTPFFQNGKYYILSRAWMDPNPTKSPLHNGTVQHVRAYDQELNKLEDFTLDISRFFKGDEQLSQNALVKIDDVVYLIGGISNNPPHERGAYSDIWMLPLTSDLKSFSGTPKKITANPNEYDTRVTAAQYSNGTLYINYQNLRKQEQFLEAFNTKNNFQSLGRLRFQDTLVGDGHSSFAIINNKIYLFYVDTNNKIRAKIIGIGTNGELTM